MDNASKYNIKIYEQNKQSFRRIRKKEEFKPFSNHYDNNSYHYELINIISEKL